MPALTPVSRSLSCNLLLLLAVVVALSAASAVGAADKPALKIAVFGPLSGAYSASGQAMLAGARWQAAQINARGGVDGRPLEIVSFDTRADPKRAARVAARIAASGAVAAVGPYFSSVALNAAPVLAGHGVPAVTGSATAPRLVEHDPWYFRVVPDNDLKGRFIALYSHGVLHQDKVNVVYEADAYGQTLYHAYRRTARRLGMQIAGAWPVDSQHADADARLDTIVAHLQQQTDPGVVFVALLGRDAAEFVRRLRKAGVKATLVGGDALGLAAFRRALDGFHDPGHTTAQYLEGVYATSYFLRDVANQNAQRFVDAFQRQTGRAPKPLTATNHDAVGIIAAALAAVPVAADTPGLRHAVRDGLQRFDSLRHAYKGVTGRLYFDRDGDVVKPSPVGVYAQGQLISAPAQLTPVVHPAAVPDLAQLLASGAAVSMNGQAYYKTRVVYTGFDLNAVRHINDKAGTFTANFYLWFRHRGPFDPTQVEFVNAVEPIHLGTPISRMNGDGTVYQAYRVTGRFAVNFDFHVFPFDRQALAIRLRHDRLRSDRLRFVADDIGMRRGAGVTALGRARGQGVLAGADGWRLADVAVFTDIDTTDSTLGNPRLFRADAETQIANSRFNVVIDVARLTRSYVLDNLVPLFFVLVLGYIMFFVPVAGPAFVARLNLGVIALLTTVSFSLKTSRELPTVGYLTLLDYLYFAVYLLLLFGIGSSIVKLAWTHRGYTRRVRWLDRISRILLPLVLISMIAVVFWWLR